MAYSFYAHVDKFDIPVFSGECQVHVQCDGPLRPVERPGFACQMTMQPPEKNGGLAQFAQVPQPSVP